VIGCGVSGLTTGLMLLNNGYNVSIIARDHYENTVSAKAAAIWFPYRAFPKAKVIEWSKYSFYEFRKLATSLSSGVSFVPFRIIEPRGTEPFWINAIPQEAKLDQKNIDICGSHFTDYTYLIPLIETQIYLPFLYDMFLQNGGSFHYQEVQDLSKLADSGSVINCTGLGSKKLCKDNDLYPILGQTVKVKSTENLVGLALEEYPTLPENELAYIIQRSDCIVLGGSAYTHTDAEIINEELTGRILQRCSFLEPKLNTDQIISVQTGLRPGRTQIRLEKDLSAPIIHNYGHGGAGFTVSWGCAREVLNLLG